MMPMCQMPPQVRADGAAGQLNVPDRNFGAPALGFARPEFSVRGGTAGLGLDGSALRRSSAHVLEVGAKFLKVQASTLSAHHVLPWEAVSGWLPAPEGEAGLG